jgi:hypothetical protein
MPFDASTLNVGSFLGRGDISGGEPRGLVEMAHFLGRHFGHCAKFDAFNCAELFVRNVPYHYAPNERTSRGIAERNFLHLKV